MKEFNISFILYILSSLFTQVSINTKYEVCVNYLSTVLRLQHMFTKTRHRCLTLKTINGGEKKFVKKKNLYR